MNTIVFPRKGMNKNIVVEAANRAKRPEDYSGNNLKKQHFQPYVETCPFCRGNEDKTPKPEIWRYPYIEDKPSDWEVRVVRNMFGAMQPSREMLSKRNFAYGHSLVVIDTPDHSKLYSELPISKMIMIFNVIKAVMEPLLKDNYVNHISIFKNEGRQAGASLEHAHHQIITFPEVPEKLKELSKGCCKVCRSGKNEYNIYTDEYVRAFVLRNSQMPFSTVVTTLEHRRGILDLTNQEIYSLFRVIKTITKFYDEKLGFPSYNVLYYDAPKSLEQFHFFVELVPRLTTPGGFELLTGIYINPTPNALAANELKAFLSDRIKDLHCIDTI